ncbi:MAG: hypothetical protein JW902_11970 [Syntrophaceae bacterium]|nr:hypothetical protein [Syntrophaceae bacterium]
MENPLFRSIWISTVLTGLRLRLSRGNFFLCYLNLLYRKFEGDLVLCKVRGEITIYDISGFYSKQGSCLDVQKQLATYPEQMKHLESTNALSISQATGIHKETVHRIRRLLPGY